MMKGLGHGLGNEVARALVVASFALVIGCAGQSEMGEPSTVSPPEVYPPDFAKPLDQFEEADVNLLASEYIDDYAGKYVTFEANVNSRHAEREGKPGHLSVNGSTYKRVLVYFRGEELGRATVGMVFNYSARIYGYVLPKDEVAVLDSTKSSFKRTVIILVRAVPAA